VATTAPAGGPVAFQGERGAYGEEAVRRFFGPVEVLPCRTLPEAFAAVATGRAGHAVVPVENSQAGSINQTYDLLLDGNLTIVGEVELPVRHCLLALPGQRVADIRQVWSHPQALAQCERFLAGLQAELLATYDTAGSARLIAEQGLRGIAAVASRTAAERYGLEVLAADIHTSPHNLTRFLVLGTGPAPRTARAKTSLVLVTRHEPGALHHCLGALAGRGINLEKLESRPTRNRPWEYLFYLDLDGHAEDPNVREALADLASRAASIRILGSYPRATSPA